MKDSPQLVVHVGGYDTEAMDGVAATIVGQCDALHARGTPLEMWVFDPHLSEPAYGTSPGGIRLCRLPRHKNPLVAAFAFPPITRRWLATRLPEVAVFHLHSVFCPANNLVAALGRPYVITPNGGWGPQVLQGRRRWLKALWISFRERRLWSRARFVQAVSEAEAKDLAALPGISPVHYIPNAVSLPPAPPAGRTRDIWLFLGRLAIEHKGLDRMVIAYAECRRNGVELPKLVLAGPDFRGGKAVIEQLARDHGVADLIELPGPVSGAAKRSLFERASLFLHTSRWEGMPLSILEAMSYGIPCLLTQGTMMVPIVTGSGSGLDAGESNPEIAAAMRLATTIDLNEMGRRARDCVSRDFSWAKVAAELSRLYPTGEHAAPAP